MAYARLSDDSDVYVIGSGTKDLKHLECMGCHLLPAKYVPEYTLPDVPGWDSPLPAHWETRVFVAVNAEHMLAHLKLHRLVGQKVPKRALRRLKSEAEGDKAKEELYFKTLMREANGGTK